MKMGFFKVKSSSESRPVSAIPTHLQQFDANAYIAANPQLKQQFSQTPSPAYSLPGAATPPPQMHYGIVAQRPGSGGNPTPQSTPPPPQSMPQRPMIDTSDAAQQQQAGQYSMVYSNSVTSPGVQDAYVVPFGQQQPQHHQQHARRHSYMPGHHAQSASISYGQSYPMQIQQPQVPQYHTMHAMQGIQPPSPPQDPSPPPMRRYSVHVNPSLQQQQQSPAPFPSQLLLQGPQRIATVKATKKLYQISEANRNSPPSEPANEFIPRNTDNRITDRDEILTVLRPMNLTDYLTITPAEDITRHIPAIDRTEAAVSEYQHPDPSSLTGQSYPLMQKSTWTRPCQEAFSSLLSWNGRRLIPYPQQSLGRLIRSEEDVLSLSEDFWLKPIHAATCAWLQAIDSARYNGEYTKGHANRLISTTMTSMDGVAENKDDLDASTLRFRKEFTLYPAVQQNNTSLAKKQVVFFMEFVSPGVLSEVGGKMWEQGRAEGVAQTVEPRFAHSYYSATRQMATTAKATKCRAGALCDYENIILFYYKSPSPETWTGAESQAEVLHLKYTDPHARYLIAELIYRSMTDMSDRLNIGDLKKVVEANQQMGVKNFGLMYQSTSVVR